MNVPYSGDSPRILQSICKEAKISAAHILPKHPGKCSRLHGHNYRIQVWASGNIGDDGMIMDFYILSQLIDRAIVTVCDHRFLNEVYPGMDTTAENLSQHWLKELHALDSQIVCVRVWETDTCYAESVIV